MNLCIFEDAASLNFLPLTHTRPVYGLLVGTMTLAGRIGREFGAKRTSYRCRPHLAGLASESGGPVNAELEGDTLCVNGRLIASADAVRALRPGAKRNTRFTNGGELVAVYFASPPGRRGRTGPRDGGGIESESASFPEVEVEADLARYPWDLVQRNADQIGRDARARRARSGARTGAKVYPGAHLVHRAGILMGRGSAVKPGAVLDAENGPVILGDGVLVMPNALIEGPAYIGPSSIVKAGAKIYHGTSAGPLTKIGGEVESSIIQGYSNKQHDGFLGHSYLGSWVNIGADTNTSDLKNTYGTVSVIVNGRPVGTGLQFVGLTMGDHSKTGINVMFDTGTVVGVACNVFGAGLPPKFVPSFSWGGGSAFAEHRLEQAIETARRVMARRGIPMTPEYEEMMRTVHSMTARERRPAAGARP